MGSRSAVALASQLEAIAYPLYDALRPLVLQQASLEPLCEMVQVLHGEVLQERVRRAAECAALEGMLERLLQDVQGRLIFRFQTFLRDGIRAFRPSPQDLDYPARLGALSAGAAADPQRGWYPTLPP